LVTVVEVGGDAGHELIVGSLQLGKQLAPCLST
jgi:hypothetical protein